jgi:SAM-dependent methyltransferase
MHHTELKKYCDIIYSLVGKGSVTERTSPKVVNEYYYKSTFFYKKFHSPEGAMHFPVSFSAQTPHREKLLYQADYIHELVNKHGYTTILELGCGLGFNSNYLASKNPDKKFVGIDITPTNIKYATKQAKALNNVRYDQGDFDSIKAEGQHYDLIFGVETLCYSTNLTSLMATLSKRLNNNGRIVIFDGYVKQNTFNFRSEVEAKAYKLLTWGFALTDFQKLDETLHTVSDFLTLESVEEYTENILPNYITLQMNSKKALNLPLLLKCLLKIGILSKPFVKHLSAGVFGPYFLKEGFLGYYKIGFVKKG